MLGSGLYHRRSPGIVPLRKAPRVVPQCRSHVILAFPLFRLSDFQVPQAARPGLPNPMTEGRNGPRAGNSQFATQENIFQTYVVELVPRI